MEAKLKDRQSVEATVEVTVPAADVDKAFESVLRQLARQIRVPGFRPGKAPRGVLVKRIGKEALDGEVREELIERNYPAAMKQFELSPVHAHVHGGTLNEGEDFTFDLHVDLYPEIELPDVEQIIIDSDGRKVDDEMVAQTVAKLRSENATMVPVDRTVQAGDYLLVETATGENSNEAGEDASADGPAAASTMPIDLDEVGEELAGQLIGRSVGEVVTLRMGSGAAFQPPARPEATESETAEPEAAESDDASTTDSDQAEDQSGEGDESTEADAHTPPTLDIRIRDVKEKEKPAADDEFAKTLGFETWQETEGRIRESLQSQLDQEAFEEQREEFVEKLMASSTFELPRSLVQRRRADLMETLTEDLRRRGMTIEAYIEHLEAKNGREEFEKELQEAAEKGVRRDLILEKLLEQRGARLSDAEFEASLRQVAMQQGTDVDRLRRDRGDDWLRNYRFLLMRDRALREAVQERLAAQKGESAESAASESVASEPAASESAPGEGAEGASETAEQESPNGEPAIKGDQ